MTEQCTQTPCRVKAQIRDFTRLGNISIAANSETGTQKKRV